MEDKLAKEEEQLNAADKEGAQALKASDERARLVCSSPRVTSGGRLIRYCLPLRRKSRG